MKKSTTLISLVSLLTLTGCINIVDSSSKVSSTNNSTKDNLSSTISSNDSLITSSSWNSISSSSNEPSEIYTITWKNFDGEVLEIDNEVAYGTLPEYNGATPLKEGTDTIKYVFNGWTPEIEIVTSDCVYTATFIEVNNNDIIPGVYPVISDDNKTIEYGFYPQTYINDNSLIHALEELEPTSYNSWYLYEGNYYVKEKATIYNNENYTFNNGTSIVNESEYWFRCDTIKWNVLSMDGGTYVLLSSTLLDAHNYYNNYDFRVENEKIINPNNYLESDIRAWLNNEFYQKAFSLNDLFIQNTYVDNSNSTLDKVYLPSYQDYLNTEYGFESNPNSGSNTRTCKTSEYARIKGAWYNTTTSLKYNGSYWTRTPSDEYSYCAWNVNSTGYLSEYAVDGNSHSVRPCITICF